MIVIDIALIVIAAILLAVWLDWLDHRDDPTPIIWTPTFYDQDRDQ